MAIATPPETTPMLAQNQDKIIMIIFLAEIVWWLTAVSVSASVVVAGPSLDVRSLWLLLVLWFHFEHLKNEGEIGLTFLSGG